MGNSRRFLDAIVKKINKLPILNNASSAIGNATERAQVKLSSVQSIATEKYNTIVKQVNGATIIQDVSSPQKLQTISPLPQRLVNWWQWYQQLTGMDKVEIAKHHVIEVQNRLFQCQDKRRNLTNQANIVNEKLKETYGELVQTRRDDPKYVQLTIMENKGLQEQSKIGLQLNMLENEERDHFTELATAIKEYHDSQAMNAQKYKYISILASAFLAILSLSGSMIYNNRRIADVRNVIADAQEKNDKTFKQCFHSLQNDSNKKFSQIMSMLQAKTTADITTQTPNNRAELTKDNFDTVTISNSYSYKTVGIYFGAIALAVYIMQQLGRS
ncbi:uncharacterized protein LOC107220986 [Neodiprion lecontei]|uniref:Uncharacterized protein LOC107220986 n=1 Tax=Neodiprion lecontei TaxID=441921 RepID=A0A6J0BNA6_NEOLC|nr:uncharacterized protein LOC107220986 [Neodiprion lecontei]